MLIGHYAPAFVIKTIDKTIPLWILFIAVQFIDIVWAFLVLLGIEKVRIVPGFTASNPFDLYYYPFSHSLLAVIIWSGTAFAVYRALPLFSGNQKAALLVGLGVFSHWVLDLIVHQPDLPLYGDAIKIGLGLWNYPILALVIEAVIFIGGVVYYLKSSTYSSASRKHGILIYAVVVLLVQISSSAGPPPTSSQPIAASLLVIYFFSAGIVFWLEKQRQPNE